MIAACSARSDQFLALRFKRTVAVVVPTYPLASVMTIVALIVRADRCGSYRPHPQPGHRRANRHLRDRAAHDRAGRTPACRQGRSLSNRRGGGERPGHRLRVGRRLSGHRLVRRHWRALGLCRRRFSRSGSRTDRRSMPCVWRPLIGDFGSWSRGSSRRTPQAWPCTNAPAFVSSARITGTASWMASGATA